MKAIVAEFRDQATVLMVTHRVNSILLNNQVLLISDGAIVEYDAIEKL